MPIIKAIGVLLLAVRRHAASAERILLRPGAGSVDHGARQLAAGLAVLADDRQHERPVFAAAARHLVHAEARDGGYPRAGLDQSGHLRRPRQRLEIVAKNLSAGRKIVGARNAPAVPLEQTLRRVVDVVAPRRENAHMGPVEHARADGCRPPRRALPGARARSDAPAAARPIGPPPMTATGSSSRFGLRPALRLTVGNSMGMLVIVILHRSFRNDRTSNQNKLYAAALASRLLGAASTQHSSLRNPSSASMAG